MLQAQKLIKLEGIAGMEAQAEEESKGETLVGSGGEAVRLPVMNKFSTISSFLGVYGQQLILRYSFYIGRSLATRET